jgi:plasmid stabilization system protein ParE
MKVIYTEEALENLDGILAFTASNYPTVYEVFQSRLQSVVKRKASTTCCPRFSGNETGLT